VPLILNLLQMTSPASIHLLKASERVYNVEQAFNVKIGGFSRKDDVLPDRLFEEKLDGGPAQGKRLQREHLEKLLDDYYEARGWDRLTTAPTRKTLEALDLKSVADDRKTKLLKDKSPKERGIFINYSKIFLEIIFFSIIMCANNALILTTTN